MTTTLRYYGVHDDGAPALAAARAATKAATDAADDLRRDILLRNHGASLDPVTLQWAKTQPVAVVASLLAALDAGDPEVDEDAPPAPTAPQKPKRFDGKQADGPNGNLPGTIPYGRSDAKPISAEAKRNFKNAGVLPVGPVRGADGRVRFHL